MLRVRLLQAGRDFASGVLRSAQAGPEVLSVRHVDHVSAQYPTGSLARITPEMIAAAQSAAARPRISNFVGGSVTGGTGQ